MNYRNRPGECLKLIFIVHLTVGQFYIIYAACAFEAVIDADDPGPGDVTADLVGQVVIDKDLADAAMGFDAQFYIA